MKTLRPWVLALALVVVAIPAMAQSFGEITGTVGDNTGAVIAGAAISVVNDATNETRNVETNEVGN